MSKIKKSGVEITFETTTGYSSREGRRSPSDAGALLWALDEIGRVMTIDGRADAARQALDEAIKRTEADIDRARGEE